MVFAASFFGAFEITLPGWLVNKSDSKADKGGFGRSVLHGADPRVGFVLLHRPDRRFGTDQIHFRRGVGAGNHDVRFFGGFCAAVHAVRAVPIRAEQPAQKRRMAQLCKGGAQVSRTGAGAEISQRGRSDLPLGHPRPGGLSGAVDRYLYAARVLPAGQDPVQTRQRSTVGRSDAAVARDRYLFVRRLPVARNVGAPLRGLSGYLPPLHTQDFVLDAAESPAGNSGGGKAGDASPSPGTAIY